MKSTEQVLPEPPEPIGPTGSIAPGGTRASSVFMGRQDYTSITLRLIVMELYKLRRRVMSKVLVICMIVATIGLYLLILIAVSLISRNSAQPEFITNFTSPLRLPQSLYLAVQLLLSLGQILIIILVSTVVGGEYSAGTIRLMLTRGPTRTQIFWSKVGMAFACIVGVVIGVAVLGVASGLLFNLATGIPATFDFLSAGWLGHAFLYLLATMLGLFMPAMLALFLSTLGRATAAGLAGALTWSFFIEPVIQVLSPFGRAIPG